MSLSTPQPSLPRFDDTLGAIMIGGLVATALYGVTCTQIYTYFVRRPKDGAVFKSIIGFLWVLDTFDAALNGHFMYFYMVSNYLNPLALTIVVWSVISHVAVTSISNFIIRGMFAHRVYLLSSGNIILTCFLLALSATDLAVSLVITGKAFQLDSFQDITTLSTLMYVNFAAGTGSDVSFATVLVFYLWRSRTGFQRTDSLIQTLVQYTINTGLLVAVDATIGMITYITMPHNFIFLAFYLQLSKLYLNSYLAALNAREGLRGRLDETVSIHLSQVSKSFPSSSQQRQAVSSPMAVRTVNPSKSQTDTMSISFQTFVDQKAAEVSPSSLHYDDMGRVA